MRPAGTCQDRPPTRARAARASVAAALALALTLTLLGCASPAGVRGHLQPDLSDVPGSLPVTWPAAPETPRYVYRGTLTGEPNFHREAPAGGALQRLGRWIAGLDEADESPLVLQRPSAVAGDDAGRVFVSDASRQAVFVFDARAGELQVWDEAAPSLRFVSPAGLAVVPAGTTRAWPGTAAVYVADAALKGVFALDAEGRAVGRIGEGLLQRPTGVAFDARTGRLFVADAAAHDIKVFDVQGRLLKVLGRRGEGPGQFNFPTHLALREGTLYVTDAMNHRVQLLDVREGAGADEGRMLRSIGRRGLFVGNLVRPKGVAVDAAGRVYVVESYYDQLLVFSPEGEFLLPIGGTGAATGQFYLPAGVWVDAEQRVHVADMFNGRLVLLQFLEDR
jgi:DNA-binding beta-propeller fold protein YncE